MSAMPRYDNSNETDIFSNMLQIGALSPLSESKGQGIKCCSKQCHLRTDKQASNKTINVGTERWLLLPTPVTMNLHTGTHIHMHAYTLSVGLLHKRNVVHTHTHICTCTLSVGLLDDLRGVRIASLAILLKPVCK